MNAFFITTRTNEELIDKLKLVKVLKTPSIEQAFEQIPRSAFVPKELQVEAFDDRPLRIAKMGFNVSAPHMYAMCLEHLKLKHGHTVLDIGCGCGHFTALCSKLVGKSGRVYGIDIRQDIIDFAIQNYVIAEGLTFQDMDFSNLKFYVRNCFVPDTEELDMKYDRIHSGASCPKDKLKDLIDMLKPGGILVTPYGDALVKVTKDEKGEVKQETVARVQYGELVLPSEEEIKAAEAKIERKRATMITVPQPGLISDLESLINDKTFSDLELEVDGKSIFVHKLILAKRSEYFKDKIKDVKKLTIDGIPYSIFLECLKYIYTDKINVTDENEVDLLSAAHILKLDRLKAIIEGYLRAKVSLSSVCKWLEVADKYHANQLYNVCLDFIVENYQHISNSEEFQNLDKKLLVEVTSEACKRLLQKQQ